MCRNIRRLYNYEPPRDREADAPRARERARKRYG